VARRIVQGNPGAFPSAIAGGAVKNEIDAGERAGNTGTGDRIPIHESRARRQRAASTVWGVRCQASRWRVGVSV